ncbi:MAG: prolyl oligopeptidase family serine peptidase, partial [Armatimonadetes bacterium]|nr:prolyl oligopeptidase family serine peptidase [Armatimonadota bacterium]
MSERTVLPAPYPRQMHDHLVRLSDELQFGRGFAADRATWEARRPLVRQALIDAVGGFPERTPLNAQVVGRIDRDGYHIEKVLYESRPGFHVTGALYVPHVDHAVPGVFCPHGHWAEGRYAPDVQRRMVGMARRGYVVLTIDKVGYEDRQGQDHRTRATFLAGVATQGVQLWDNIRGLDYLCARPEVDSSRIGCTGCSGGGNQTMYLSALDERITASAPVCSVEMGECYMHKLFCTCELVPGLRRFADLADICSLIAPRALLLVHGLLDFGFLIDSARKVFLRIQKVYEALRVPERLHHFTSYDTHAYNLEMREAVYAHFDRHLKGLEPPYAPEGEVPIEEFADLRVLPEGLPEGARTMLTIYRELSDPLPPRPAVSDQVA